MLEASVAGLECQRTVSTLYMSDELAGNMIDECVRRIK